MAAETLSAVLIASGGSAPAPSFFVHTATLEFQASLELLVQRARFLTGASGVAFALQEEGRFVYSGVGGEFPAESGGTADLRKKYLNECARLGNAIRTRAESGFALAVPVMRGAEVAGIFELLGETAFEERDAEAVGRLAEMAGTAMEHRDAAARAEKFEFEEDIDAVSELTPLRWHASEASELVEEERAPVSPIAVQTCATCGFPVSAGRKLCVDCEKNTELAHEPVELFSSPAEESWISAHGYTIASALVSVIALAIIMWLRGR